MIDIWLYLLIELELRIKRRALRCKSKNIVEKQRWTNSDTGQTYLEVRGKIIRSEAHAWDWSFDRIVCPCLERRKHPCYATLSYQVQGRITHASHLICTGHSHRVLCAQLALLHTHFLGPLRSLVRMGNRVALISRLFYY